MCRNKLKSNKLLVIGLLANALYFLTKDISAIPSFYHGALLGIALIGMIFGLYRGKQKMKHS